MTDAFDHCMLVSKVSFISVQISNKHVNAVNATNNRKRFPHHRILIRNKRCPFPLKFKTSCYCYKVTIYLNWTGELHFWPHLQLAMACIKVGKFKTMAIFNEPSK